MNSGWAPRGGEIMEGEGTLRGSSIQSAGIMVTREWHPSTPPCGTPERNRRTIFGAHHHGGPLV